LLCFWNLFTAAFCSAQSVIANVPGGNAGREFPVVRIAEWPESNGIINRTRTSFFGINGVLVHSSKRSADNKDPRGLTGLRNNRENTQQARSAREQRACARAAQSAGTLTNEKTDKAQRTHDTPTNRSNAMRSGVRSLEQAQRTINYKTTNRVIGSTDNKQQRGHI
jgi:hypothetical protein